MYARALLASRWLACLLAAFPGLILACVEDESVYNTNNASPGEWYADFITGPGAFNYTTSPAKGTISEARAEGIAARYYPGCPGATFTNEQLTTNTATTKTWQWETRNSSGMWCGYSSVRLVRYSTSWPAGYTHELCPEPCNGDFPAGAKTLAVASDKPDNYSPPETICSAGNCELILIPSKYQRLGPSGDREYLFMYQGTGLDCEVPTSSITPSPTDTETCVGDWCRSPGTGENCGYFNNSYVCLDKTQPDRCWKNADGSMLCAEAAPMPPKPDSGTAGEPAVPTQTIEACTGENSCQTIQYFNSTAVSNSSRPVPDGAGPSGSGAIDGEGAVTDEEAAQGSASGGLGCDAAPSCDGDPISCAILAQQWRTRCVESPSDSALESELGPVEGEDGELFGSASFEAATSFDSAGWMGAATCLADYSLNLGSLLGTVEIPFSEWCWLLEVIGVFVMIAAYVSAARILIGGI